MEDLLVRKLWELCNRAHALITMKDNCMDTFLRFCENLSTDKRNRLLTAFSVFDKGDLLDYVQLVKPHLLQDSTTQSLVSTEQSYKSLRQSTIGNRNTGSGEVTKPGALRSMQLAPFVSRVEALRKAGHPFLKIVDKIIDVRLKHFLSYLVEFWPMAQRLLMCLLMCMCAPSLSPIRGRACCACRTNTFIQRPPWTRKLMQAVGLKLCGMVL